LAGRDVEHAAIADGEIQLQVSQKFSGFDDQAEKYEPTTKLVEMYPDSLEAREASGNQGSEPWDP